MSSAVQDLLAILDLERLELNLFRGRSPQVGWQRVFGGQVIGQALVAACRTVDVAGRPPHSLHAYFLLPGDPKVPIIYEVDRIRDGKSFTTRRVVAIQHGQAIYTMAVSFHRDEPGMSHQAKMPQVTKPEDFQGLKYRTVGISIDVFTAMGAAVNALPGGEIVSAIDRGLLDAAEFNNSSSDRALGFADVSKICMLQSYHQNAEQLEISFNKDKFRGLPPKMQAISVISLRGRAVL